MRSALLRRSVPPVPSFLGVGFVTSSGGAQHCCVHCPSYGDLDGIGNFALDTRNTESPYAAFHEWGSGGHEQYGERD
jgi:hypothetical protein